MSKHSSSGRAWRQLAAHVKAQQPWCTFCHSTEYLSVDHIVPKAIGGTDEEENLQVLCRRCNASKQAKTLTRLAWAKW